MAYLWSPFLSVLAKGTASGRVFGPRILHLGRTWEWEKGSCCPDVISLMILTEGRKQRPVCLSSLASSSSRFFKVIK